MRTVYAFPRAARSALVVAATAAVLSGCGGGDDSSPFAPPKDGSDATARLGIPVLATRNTTRTATDDAVAAAAASAQAAFPGGSRAGRPKAVAIVDRGDWRSALAATALVAPPVGAPLLFSDGGDLPATTTKAIETLQPTGGSGAGDQALRIGDAGRPTGVRVREIAGRDPYEIARAIDRYTTVARNRTADRVLVVSADRPEFAIPAAAWLAKSGDPLAFVTAKGIPPATARQLAAHPKATLYVLGPSAVIRPTITRQLRRYGIVKRVGGVTPVDNAIGFARYQDGAFGWGAVLPGHGFSVARSTDALGAIALAPFSASGLHGPLLLTDRADAVPTSLRDYLLDVKPGFDPNVRDLEASNIRTYNRAWIAGTPEQISARQQAQLDTLLEVGPVDTDPDAGEDLLDDGPAPSGATSTAPGGATTTTPTPRP